jgi:hypothetical protein
MTNNRAEISTRIAERTIFSLFFGGSAAMIFFIYFFSIESGIIYVKGLNTSGKKKKEGRKKERKEKYTRNNGRSLF